MRWGPGGIGRWGDRGAGAKPPRYHGNRVTQWRNGWMRENEPREGEQNVVSGKKR